MTGPSGGSMSMAGPEQDFLWTIEGFTKLAGQQYTQPNMYLGPGPSASWWRLMFHGPEAPGAEPPEKKRGRPRRPRPSDEAKPEHLGVFLCLVQPEALPGLEVHIQLTVHNRVNPALSLSTSGVHRFVAPNALFFGRADLASMRYVLNETLGFLSGDTLTIGAKIRISPDSSQPPRDEWKGPPGFEAGPSRQQAGPLPPSSGPHGQPMGPHPPFINGTRSPQLRSQVPPTSIPDPFEPKPVPPVDPFAPPPPPGPFAMPPPPSLPMPPPVPPGPSRPMYPPPHPPGVPPDANAIIQAQHERIAYLEQALDEARRALQARSEDPTDRDRLAAMKAEAERANTLLSTAVRLDDEHIASLTAAGLGQLVQRLASASVVLSERAAAAARAEARGFECAACLQQRDRSAVVALIPCGHALCASCAVGMERRPCPKCRERSTALVRVAL